jgi:hypothetical protein
MARQHIKLGYTFEYFIPGVLLIIIGGVCFLGNALAAIFLLVLGIILILLRSGIEIDEGRKSVRKFYDCFSIRFGRWISVKNMQAVELRFTNESKTMQHRGGQTSVRTKTFDIVFVKKSGTSYELNDFKSYHVATQALKLISQTFDLGARNIVEERRAAAILRRKKA